MAEYDIWDSWEDFADSNELDKHVDEYLKLSNGTSNSENAIESTEEKVKTSSASGSQFRILQRPLVHEDDQNRTAYIPQVKILRRPGAQNSSQEFDQDQLSKSQPLKTLAEREAAYAEARKRIMGASAMESNGGGGGGGSRNKSRSENHSKSKGHKHDTDQARNMRANK